MTQIALKPNVPLKPYVEKALKIFDERMKRAGFQLRLQEYADATQTYIFDYSPSIDMYKKILENGYSHKLAVLLEAKPESNVITLTFFTESPMKKPYKSYEIEARYRVYKRKIKPLKVIHMHSPETYWEHVYKRTKDMRKRPAILID